jgi:hypothetical protein
VGVVEAELTQVGVNPALDKFEDLAASGARRPIARPIGAAASWLLRSHRPEPPEPTHAFCSQDKTALNTRLEVTHT